MRLEPESAHDRVVFPSLDFGCPRLLRHAQVNLRRSRSFALLVALVVGVPLGIGLPGSSAVLAADSAAPGGRLVVVWKSDAAKVHGPRTNVGHIKSVARRISVVTAPRGQSGEVAAALRADPGVVSVVPDAVVSIDAWPTDGTPPSDTYYAGYQNDLSRIGMPEAWQLTTGSRSTVVAVLDTGLHPHVDIDGSAVVSPHNMITGTDDVVDGQGHGTHVTGTIAASADNGAGVAGIAPGVSLMPVKVLADDGSGYFSDTVAGVDWARTHGASVINLSLGGYLTADQAAAYRPAFDAAIAAGVVIVAAAGNDGANGVSSFYPAAFPGVIAVGSTQIDDSRASYSNAGPHNTISAPGSSILSLSKDGTGYVFMSGTSMATPHVVGAAALLRTLHPDETVAQVTESLCSSSVDLGAPGRDDVFGCGRLDVAAALLLGVPSVDDPTPPSAGPPPATPRDATAPKVRSRTPGASASGVNRRAVVSVVFSEAVKGVSTRTLWLVNTRTGARLRATVAYASSRRTATIRSQTTMAGLTRYRVVIGRGITDAAGNRLATQSWLFTTRR
jgi:subtilisin family serine protease